jgi:hypothetical protein
MERLWWGYRRRDEIRFSPCLSGCGGVGGAGLRVVQYFIHGSVFRG